MTVFACVDQSNNGRKPAGDSTPNVADHDDRCPQAIAALAGKMSEDQECTVVVRSSYNDGRILGYQVFCAQADSVTEGDALLASQVHATCGFGDWDNIGTTEDEYVFYEAATDAGCIGVVSARNGMPLFGGTIEWMGLGQITHPSDWYASDDIDMSCAPTALWVDRVYDPYEEAHGSDYSAAISMIEMGPIPAALNDGVRSLAVLLYAPRLGVSRGSSTSRR